jgi:hypothetical protein
LAEGAKPSSTGRELQTSKTEVRRPDSGWPAGLFDRASHRHRHFVRHYPALVVTMNINGVSLHSLDDVVY